MNEDKLASSKSMDELRTMNAGLLEELKESFAKYQKWGPLMIGVCLFMLFLWVVGSPLATLATSIVFWTLFFWGWWPAKIRYERAKAKADAYIECMTCMNNVLTELNSIKRAQKDVTAQPTEAKV